MAGPNEYAAVLRAQREDVPGAAEVLWFRNRINSRLDRRDAILRRHARIYALRRFKQYSVIDVTSLFICQPAR